MSRRGDALELGYAYPCLQESWEKYEERKEGAIIWVGTDGSDRIKYIHR